MRTSEIKDHFQSLKYYYNEDPYGSICMLTEDSKQEKKQSIYKSHPDSGFRILGQRGWTSFTDNNPAKSGLQTEGNC